MEQNGPVNKVSPNPIIHGFEDFFLDVIHVSENLVLESIMVSQKVLQKAESFGKTIPSFLSNIGQVQSEIRHTVKDFSQETTQDTIDVCEDIVHGFGQVAKTTLSEIEELGKITEGIGKDVLDALSLIYPFQAKTSYPKRKEPTIIPITIQDN